jgi:hypothetical protein
MNPGANRQSLVVVDAALALIAIVLFSAAPRRAATWAAAALALQIVVFTAVFGWGMWDDTVIAQISSGRRGLGVLKGVWGQAFWSLIGLVALAGVAWWRRAKAHDPPLLRVSLALAVAMLATLVTNTKDGTGQNVLVPVEAALLPLTLAGAAWLERRVLAGLLLAFTFVQSASLIVSPRTETPFLYPTSERGAWGRAGSASDVRQEVAKAATCPPGVAYSGPPFLAFLADRPMPDAQPDQFLPLHSTHLAGVAARIAAAQPRCP